MAIRKQLRKSIVKQHQRLIGQPCKVVAGIYRFLEAVAPRYNNGNPKGTRRRKYIFAQIVGRSYHLQIRVAPRAHSSVAFESSGDSLSSFYEVNLQKHKHLNMETRYDKLPATALQ
jgi:hypothetical protein